MARKPARTDTGLEEEFDDEDVKVFVRALERLASDPANGERERDDILRVGRLFLATYLSSERSRLRRRLLEQMAGVLRLGSDSTGEERLVRAGMLVEASARAFQRSGKRHVPIGLARRLAMLTSEPKLLAALRDESTFAFVAKTLRQWVGAKQPRAGQLSTNGVLGVLAYRFKLWGIAGQSEEDVRRAIARRILAAKSAPTVSSVSRKTRAKRR